MKTIEINTTQNVVITYEVAPVRDRILAYVIDLLVLFGFMIVTSIVGGIVGGDTFYEYVYYLILAPVFIFYALVSEIVTTGQSIGKKAMKIQVVKLNGKEPQNSDFVLRWVFRMIDIILSFGTIAAIFISSSKKGQRIGDLLAETSVIKLQPSKNIKFSDIQGIQTKSSYYVTYEDAGKFSEEEMLLIRQVINRNRQFPNESHKQVLTELVEKVKARLGLMKYLETSDEEFLETLIKDYIAVTR